MLHIILDLYNVILDVDITFYISITILLKNDARVVCRVVAMEKINKEGVWFKN